MFPARQFRQSPLRWGLCAFALTLLCVSLPRPAPAQNDRPFAMRDYWPLSDGMRLEYRRQHSDGRQRDIELNVRGPVWIGPYQAYRFRWSERGSRVWNQAYYNWSGGNLQIYREEDWENRSVMYTNPLEFLPRELRADAVDVPVGDGGAFYTDDYEGTAQTRATCLGLKEIQTPAGVFQTLHVRVVANWTNTLGGEGITTHDYWLAIGLGMARHRGHKQVFTPGSGWSEAWTQDELLSADVLVDHSARMPPVGDQRNARHSVGLYNSGPFAHGYGAGVAWALGYYARSRQEAAFAASEDYATSPGQYVMSPWFLWSNGGGGLIASAIELMKAHGVTRADSFPSLETTTSDTHLTEAASYRILGGAPFFARTPSVSARGIFTSRWNNPVAPLKQWLAGRSYDENAGPPPGGDSVILAIPVFASFEQYQGGVYDVADSRRENFLGYHALCVVGYSDVVQAFRVVNSWGPDWGMNGYGWLSYDFVRQYAIEAWWMENARRFEPDEGGKVYRADRRQVVWSRDYRIIYTPTRRTGEMTVDARGVLIQGGADGDQLKIVRLPGALYGETIPQVLTDGGFFRVYTEAPIGEIVTSGALRAVSAVRCHVGRLVGADIQQVRMMAEANSTWHTLSREIYHHSGGYYENSGYMLNDFADVEIHDTLVKPLSEVLPLPADPDAWIVRSQRRLNISLVGVRLRHLTSNWDTRAHISTKPYAFFGEPIYYAQGDLGGYGAVIDVVGVLNARIHGGRFHADLARCYGVGSIQVTGMRYRALSRGAVGEANLRKVDHFDGDFLVRDFLSHWHIENLTTQGGDIRFCLLASKTNIDTLAARHRVLQLPGKRTYRGGFLGNYDGPSAGRVIAGFGEERNNKWASIVRARGDTGVSAAFIAGSDLTGGPSFLGYLGKVVVGQRSDVVLTKPLIHGSAYVASGSQIQLVGDRHAEAAGRFYIYVR